MSSSPLYSIGRGTVWALLTVTLPFVLVTLYYRKIQHSVEVAREMPLLKNLRNDFKSGLEVVGVRFEEKRQRFYADTLKETESDKLRPDRRWKPGHEQSYWDRNLIELDLIRNLPRNQRANMRAYLDYVEQYRPLALEEMYRTKIPASITLAQGILETNAGRAFLAKKANNHFGIKCRAKPGFRQGGIQDEDFTAHSLAYDCVQMTDDYTWDRFEVYASARESYRRHSLLLQEARYRWMLRDYEMGGTYTIPRKLYGRTVVPYYAAWCVGLKSSGYATAPNYAETLTMIIETYELWKIDYELLL